MRLKPGVEMKGIKPECVIGIMICDGIYKLNEYDLVVTSITDGSHSRGSLHYVGFAFDLRTRDIKPSELAGIHTQLQESLGVEFDVVLEKDHFHVEFQPKK